MLKERSNEAIYARWLADHPGNTTVPENVKNILQNLKSVLRKQKGKKGRRRQLEAEAAERAPVQQARPKASGRTLEQLEGMIDECLYAARGLNAEGLEGAIGLLRQARNEVIRQGGVKD